MTRPEAEASAGTVVIRAMVDVCHDTGALVVAEGVETSAERSALVDLGCDFLQGYLIGRPAPLVPPDA
ncbi:MAG TPA: EAL domain-containing protein [Vicinamibacteria bacterium]|nr:EAL domain-containing protein [Vicinamibacteria bacterium]